jgi:hypothetical protein
MPDDTQVPLVSYTPLFEAQNSARYDRQTLIKNYQDVHDCNLIVVSDFLFAYGVTYFEELLSGIDPARDLHVLLNSPGGDGEVAVRLIRSCQLRCKNLVVIVVDWAKSAATLFALGAHQILMGPAADLGPVDPQMQVGGRIGIASAKDIIAAVEDATLKVQAAPETYPVWASLLSDITGVMVQQARSALTRSNDLLREALASEPTRTPEDLARLTQTLEEPLITRPQSHGAIFSADDAERCGLPVVKLEPSGDHWREIWRLWSRYLMVGNAAVYEGERASQILPRVPE